MNDTTEVFKEYVAFKYRIYKYTLVSAVIFELISLLIFGLSFRFFYGLALGTCIAIINFQFHAWTCKQIVYGGKGAGMSVFGFVIRLLLYGGAYYICGKTDIIQCGFGCIAGFLTIKTAILYLHAFRAWFVEMKKFKTKQALKTQESKEAESGGMPEGASNKERQKESEEE